MSKLMLSKNIGDFDRLFRLIAGCEIMLFGIVFRSWWGVLGAVFVFTAITGWCGLYQLLRVNTCAFNRTKTSGS